VQFNAEKAQFLASCLVHSGSVWKSADCNPAPSFWSRALSPRGRGIFPRAQKALWERNWHLPPQKMACCTSLLRLAELTGLSPLVRQRGPLCCARPAWSRESSAGQMHGARRPDAVRTAS